MLPVGTGCLSLKHYEFDCLQVQATHAGAASALEPLRVHAFLLTLRHQGTLAPMLFHKLVGGAEYPEPKKPPSQGKGAAHRNLQNLKGVTVTTATFKARLCAHSLPLLLVSILLLRVPDYTIT